MHYYEEYTKELQETLDCLPFHLIEKLENVLFDARVSNQQVFIMGNGGSASTASHFVCDLAKNTRNPRLPHFRVIGLTDNMAILTAYANDDGYDSVFADQLVNFACDKDVVIAISTSGNSPNVIKAIELARQLGATTVGFTGFDGGKLGAIVDINIHVPNHCVEQVEDVHLVLEHMIVKKLKHRLDNQKYFVEATAPAKLPLLSSVAVHGSNENGYVKAIFQEIKSDNLKEGLLSLVNLAVHELDADGGNIILFDQQGNPLESFFSRNGTKDKSDPNQYHIEDVARDGLAGWVKQNSSAALVPTTYKDPRWLQRSWDRDPNDSRSAISAPIMAEDKVIGVMTLVRNAEKGPFTIKELSLLVGVFSKFPAMQMSLVYHPSDEQQV